MSSPPSFRLRRDSLASISSSSQIDKAQLAQALDKIHNSASQSDALTTFNDFAPPPGSSPAAESKGGAGELVQQGLSGLYSRLKEAVGVTGKAPAQEPDHAQGSNADAASKRGLVPVSARHTARSSVVTLPKGESGGTISTFNSSMSGDAQYATTSSSGAITAESISQLPQSSKASSMTTVAASKSTSSSAQNLPKMVKAVTSTVANPSVAPITVSAFKDKDSSRGVTTRVEDGPLPGRAGSASKNSEAAAAVPSLPATVSSFDSGDLKLVLPSRSRRDDGLSIAGSSDKALSPLKGSAASVQSVETNFTTSGSTTQRLAPREVVRKPAVIDRISRSRTAGGSRSRSSSLEPGMAEPSPISTAAHNMVHHDSFVQQNKTQQLASGRLRIPGTTTNEGAPHAVSARLESMRKQVVSKEFWMADETCKECFLCGQPFSAFRRKHHCRTCGCIFDSKCTSTISGQKFGVAGTLRVCKTCLDIINRRYDSGSDDSGDDSYLPGIFRTGARGAQAGQRPRGDDESSIYEKPEDGGDDLRSATTPMMAIPATRRIGDSQILEIDAPQLSRPSSSRSLRSLGGRPLSSGHRRNHSKPFFMGRFRPNVEERAPFRKTMSDELARKARLPAFHDDNIIDPELEPYMSDESSGDEQMSIFATMASNDVVPPSLDPDKSNFGPFLSTGKRHRMRQGEKSISGLSFTSRGLDDGAGAHPSGLASHGHHRPLRRRNMSTTSASQHPVLRSPRPRSGVFSKGFPSVVGGGGGGPYGEASGPYEFPAVEATKLTRSASIRDDRPTESQLSPSSLKHVRKLLQQLLHDGGIPNTAAWEKALVPILLRCADDVTPNARQMDLMDIRNYVKLKKIPGSKPGDTSYVSGLIFTKNLALKSMPRSILNPRIVIVSFPIEYQRHQQHFMSLQPVIQQEKEFLRVLVNRIIALRPHVLLAEKSVAGVALQYLSEANIAVAYNVKSSMIWAVSRCAKASVISSLDMLALPANVGQAGGFEVKTFVNKEIPGRKKTYIFVSGCDKELGCTIALRGASTQVLSAVKRITDFMVYVVYNLKLESCLMRDEFIRQPEAGDEASWPSTSREPTDETVKSMAVSDEALTSSTPSLPAAVPSNTNTVGDETTINDLQAPQPQTQTQTHSSVQAVEGQVPMTNQQPELQPGDSMASDSQAKSTAAPGSESLDVPEPDSAATVDGMSPAERPRPQSRASPVPEDVPMPTFYSDMVTKYQTKILSASPAVKFSQPYLLMRAREQERRLVHLKRLRDQAFVDDQSGEGEQTKPARFQLIKPEMVHEIGQKAPRHIREVLHAVHDAEYDKALHNYMTQTRQWENFIQGNIDLFDPMVHQNIVVLHSLICTETKIPCVGPGMVAFEFYEQDPENGGVSVFMSDCPLGRYIENYCISAFRSCDSRGCARPMWQHHRTYVHEEARLTLFIEVEAPLPNGTVVEMDDDDIYMWNYCKLCKKDLGIMVMSDSTWKYSFGKYLELSFWGKGLQLHPAAGCPHDHQTAHIRYFNFQGTSVRFHYDPIDLLEIIVPRARITWKVDHDLRLKNDAFTKVEERWTRFMASVKARLKSIRIDSVLPEKTEACRAEVERLMRLAHEDQPELVRKLQAAYMNSKYYEVVPMNPVVRDMLERVSEWDAAFAKFEADFLSDKDVRQLTMIQLRKMFGDSESKESLPSTDATSILTMGSCETDEKTGTTTVTTQTSMSTDEYDDKSTSQPGAAAADACESLPATVDHLDLATSRPSVPSKNAAADNPGSSVTADDGPAAVPQQLQPPARPPLESKTAPIPQHDPPFPASPPPLKSAPSLTEKVEQIRREFRALSGETNQLAAAVANAEAHAEGKMVLPPMPVPERGSSRRAGPSVSPPMVRATSQPAAVYTRAQSSLGRHAPVRDPTARLLEQPDPTAELARPLPAPQHGIAHHAESTSSGKSEKKLSERLGLGALKGHRNSGKSSIPRYVHKKKESRVSALAKHFEQLSREFEKERVRDRKRRADKMHNSRAFLPRTLTKATVEVYKDVKEAVQELVHEDEPVPGRGRTRVDSLPLTTPVTPLPPESAGSAKEQPPQGSDPTDGAGQSAASRAAASTVVVAAPAEAAAPSSTEAPLHPDEPSTETEGEGEGEGEGDGNDGSKHDESRAASDDEGASDADHSSLLLDDILHMPETLEENLEEPRLQKSSLMKMLTNFWAERSASGWPQLEYPLNATDHIFIDSDVIVREDEPSSLIAFALSSTDYQAKLADIRRTWKQSANRPSRPRAGPPPPAAAPDAPVSEPDDLLGVEAQEDKRDGEHTVGDPNEGSTDAENSGADSVDGAPETTGRVTSGSHRTVHWEETQEAAAAAEATASAATTAEAPDLGLSYPAEAEHGDGREEEEGLESEDASLPEKELERSLLRSTGTHLKYQFTDGSAKMLCKIFYAEQFDALRHKCGVADRIVESLSRCVKWDSRGGKTKAVFLRTLDERLVMKSLSPIETSAFLKFAPAYFNLMAEALFHELPSVIAKMLGFFQVIIKNPMTNTEIKLDLLLMENLFYDRSPARIFDLKGSMRNRKIESTGEQNEVLLDENMVEYIYESPLFAREHSKKILHLSVWNDTLFLMRQNVMDYSLMVAVDEAKKELVVGIIDCIRTYTWDKKLEFWIKDRGFAGGGRLKPTVTTPKEYKSRFRVAMERYILQAPNCWHQFGIPGGFYPLMASMTPRHGFRLTRFGDGAAVSGGPAAGGPDAGGSVVASGANLDAYDDDDENEYRDERVQQGGGARAGSSATAAE